MTGLPDASELEHARLALSVEGPLATITLNRPDRRNSQTPTMWRTLAPVGRAASGGYVRQPFTTAEREARAWFLEECRRRDLRVEEDGFGNVVAWWDPAAGTTSGQADQKAVLTGSHLDSVVQGGAFDGPLGVVSALAALDLLRERGLRPRRPPR